MVSSLARKVASKNAHGSFVGNPVYHGFVDTSLSCSTIYFFNLISDIILKINCLWP